MKIGILSRNAKLYSTKRLKEAAVARGHTVRVVDYTRCYMNITSHRPEASRYTSTASGFACTVSLLKGNLPYAGS